MQLTPQQALLQCAHVFQQTLFPALEAEIGALTQSLKLLSAVVNLIPLGAALSSRRASTGRPPRDRAALATAFLNFAIRRQACRRLTSQPFF